MADPSDSTRPSLNEDKEQEEEVHLGFEKAIFYNRPHLHATAVQKTKNLHSHYEKLFTVIALLDIFKLLDWHRLGIKINGE